MRPLLDPAAAALLRALRALGHDFVVVEAVSTPWASITFEGARHRFALRLADQAAAARLAALLPEQDFRLHRHLVAEVAEIIVAGCEIRFAALTVVDA